MKVMQGVEDMQSSDRVRQRYARPDLKVFGQVADLTKGTGGTKMDGTEPSKKNPPGLS